MWERAQETGRPAVLDNFDDLDHHFPVNFLTPSSGTLFQREIEELQECLIRRRLSGNMDTNPLLEFVTEMWCRIVPPTMTLKRALRIFRMGDVLTEALSQCRDVEAAQWWNSLPSHPASLEKIVGPAERILSILGRHCIACRSYRGTNTFLQMIDQGFSYCAEGGEVIPQAELRFLLQTRLKQLIRYKQQGGKAQLVIVIEESEAGQMISPAEIQGLQTLRKTGCRFIIVCQEPYWIDDPTTQAVLQNTNHLWLGAGSARVAEMMADDMMVLFNPYAIKERTDRPMQVGDNSFLQSQFTYFTPQEQHQMIQAWLRKLPIGAGFAVSDGNVRYVQFPRFTTSITDTERRRKRQPWLMRTSIIEPATHSTSDSTTSIPTEPQTPLPPGSGPPTQSAIDGLFD